VHKGHLRRIWRYKFWKIKQ